MRGSAGLTCSLFISCAFVTGALAQTADALGAAQVQWVDAPSGGTDWRNWPERALRLEISGSAVLKCGHDEQGRLSNCKVLEQSRREIGFGEAALRLAKTFRLKTTLSDGSPLTAGEVTFTVPFRYDALP